NKFTFHKKIDTYGIAQFVFSFKSMEFNDFLFWRSTCFFKVARFGLVSTFFCLVIETKLKGFVPVHLFGSDLGNHTWPSFKDGTWNVLSILVKNAGHADFFTY